MAEIHISIRDVAAELGTRKQTVFKVMKRLGISATKRRDESRGNQVVSYVTQEEFQRIRTDLTTRLPSAGNQESVVANDDGFVSSEIGVFYLVRLEPEHDPTRFKVGFAANLSERLRQLRCSAPFTEVIETWPCKRLWEKTAIECVTPGCERLHTEVFRVASLDVVLTRCRQFFDLMPVLRTDGINNDVLLSP